MKMLKPRVIFLQEMDFQGDIICWMFYIIYGKEITTKQGGVSFFFQNIPETFSS